MNGAAELSVGNILGSNLVNLTLVLGVAAIAARHMKIDQENESSLVKIMILITAVTAWIFFTGRLNPFHGVLLLACYLGSILWLRQGGLMNEIMKEEQEEAEEELEEEAFSGPVATGMKLLGSTALVVIGAELAVNSAVNIGTIMNVPLEVIGATAVAVGTGLPELSIELNAVKNKEYGLALGNIFGSVLVNFTLILGLLSVISPVQVNIDALVHLLPFLGAALVLLWHTVLNEHEISREIGLALVLFFVLFIFEEIGFIL
jgi:cation:H+ antiporter